MNLLEALALEHALFRKALMRLEAALALPEPQARERAADLLRGLLPALEGHEDLEFALVAEPAPGERDLGRLVEAERLDLENLREDIADLLDGAGAPMERLRARAALLKHKLESHFLTEEIALWPVLARRGSRSLTASLARRAQLRLERIEEDLEWRRSRLDELLA